jgi:glutamyl-Q tRNA(Asp) synthetase
MGPNGEQGEYAVDPLLFGDVVLARKDTPASYHLAVVADDADQGVTRVTRGNDLFAAAHIQRVLQALLDLPVPDYAHHRLIRDASGKRLAKRDAATALRSLRQQGKTPSDVRAMLQPIP